MAAPESPGTQAVGKQSHGISTLSLGYGAGWAVLQKSRKETSVIAPAGSLQWPGPRSIES